MNNKTLGYILFGFCLILTIILFAVWYSTYNYYQGEIDSYVNADVDCPSDPNLCPHEQRSRAQIPIFIGLIFIVGIMALSVYLIFFEKSQKEIINVLENQKKIQTEEERFTILLKGLSEDEQIVIKAVKEQDGITQQTLRYRTGMHKSKLSIILDNLEKKQLITREDFNKTKKVFLKIRI